MRTSARIITAQALIAVAAHCAVPGSARAGDLGSAYTVPPISTTETWSGFSLGVGGGVGFLNADVSSKASRTDNVTACSGDPATCLGYVSINQTYTSNIDGLGDTGGFFTVQAAYDYQFASEWVLGAFVDADWSDVSANAKQTGASSVAFCNGCGGPGTLHPSSATIDTLLSSDWSISVGGRLGWLATPGTLLYVLGAYTHADLDDARVKVSIGDPNSVIGAIVNNGGSSPFSNSPTSLSVNLPDSVDGFSLGGGAEAKLGGPWALKLEYRWTHFDGGSGQASSSKNQGPTSAACNPDCIAVSRNINSQASADYDLDIQTVRAVMTYHFWSGGGG
jgi:outer membrane immunogenic protein